MYDPKVARFLQEDTYTGTADDPLSLNLYTYVKNNPLIYYDPTGHSEAMISLWDYKGYSPWEEQTDSSTLPGDFIGPLSPEQTREYKGTGSQKPTNNIDEKVLFGGVGGVTVKTGFDALKEANKVISEYAAKEAAAKSATTGAKVFGAATIGKLLLATAPFIFLTGDTYHDPDEKTALPPGFVEVNGYGWSSDTGFILPSEAWDLHNEKIKNAPIFEWNGFFIKSISFGNFGPRYGERRISDELYDELRKATPSKKIQNKMKKKTVIGAPDIALPGKTITSTLQADHIVSMDKITKMEGFDKLTYEQQKAVLNYEDNFIGLSEAANKSKGAKSYEEWTIYKKENIEVNAEFRAFMIYRERELENDLQKLIDGYLK